MNLATRASLDHAFSLLLDGDADAALRWSASALEREPSPAAMLATARSLARIGRPRAAAHGLRAVIERAIEARDAPLAIIACDDLRRLGGEPGPELDRIAAALARPPGAPHATALVPGSDHEPLSEQLRGSALAAKATHILYDALDRSVAPVHASPLFESLAADSLRELLALFEAITVPAGGVILREGESGQTAFILAYGEAEIGGNLRVSEGAFFGEAAILATLPSPVGVLATRPTMLLTVEREALAQLAARRPDVAQEIDAHCRRAAAANLGGISPFVAALSPAERAALAERTEVRVFEEGERLQAEGAEVSGLYVVISGEVALVARDQGERTVLATVPPGGSVGELELVLWRRSAVDAIATRRTGALFLSRASFHRLVLEQPAILHVLHALSLERQAETKRALDAEPSDVVDEECVLDDTLVRPFPSAAPVMRDEPSVVVDDTIVEDRTRPTDRRLRAAAAASSPPSRATLRPPAPESTPSVAPAMTTVTTVRPSAPAPSGTLGRRAMQAGTVIAAAAALAVVLSTREHPVTPPGPVAAGAAVPAMEPERAAPPVVAAPAPAPSASAPPPPPPAVALSAASIPVAPPASSTRPRPASRAPRPVAADAPRPTPAATIADELGGRE